MKLNVEMALSFFKTNVANSGRLLRKQKNQIKLNRSKMKTMKKKKNTMRRRKKMSMIAKGNSSLIGIRTLIKSLVKVTLSSRQCLRLTAIQPYL